MKQLKKNPSTQEKRGHLNKMEGKFAHGIALVMPPPQCHVSGFFKDQDYLCVSVCMSVWPLNTTLCLTFESLVELDATQCFGNGMVRATPFGA